MTSLSTYSNPTLSNLGASSVEDMTAYVGEGKKQNLIPSVMLEESELYTY